MKMNDKKLEAAFRSFPWVAAAFMLGSAARGCQRADSDVDVAVLPGPDDKPTVLERVELAVQLEGILHRDIDLGILSTDNLVYAKEAYLTGRCIYSRNEFHRDLFGATALGLYAGLRQERREIEDAYRID